VITVDDMCKTLRESGLTNGPAAADIIASGIKSLRFEEPVEAAHIQRVYERRSRHLASMPSEHGRQLKHSVDELLREIDARKVQSIKSLEIPADGLGSFQVWVDSETHAPIGCFYTIAQQELSAPGWKKLWGAS